jgi:hypothetical protein
MLYGVVSVFSSLPALFGDLIIALKLKSALVFSG